MVAEERAPHGMPGDRGDLFVLRLQRRNLVFFFPHDFLLGKRGVEKHIGQKLEADLQVGTHRLHGRAEAVVSRVGADLSADRFDFFVDVFRGTRCGAFDQGACGERRDAVGFLRLGQQSAAENRHGLGEGEFVVFANQHAQSVGQFELLDLAPARFRPAAGRRGQRAFRVERGDGHSRHREVFFRHAAQVVCRDARNLAQIFGAEVRVAGEEPTSTDVRGASARGRKIVELVGEDALARLGHLRLRGRGGAVFGHDFQHLLLGFLPLAGFAEEIDAEEAHLARHVGISGDVVHEVLFLAQFEVERRAAPAAQHRGEDIKRCGVWMGEGRNMPDEGAAREFGLELLVRVAPADLRRFVRNEERFERAALAAAEPLFRRRENFPCLHIADHDKEHVVRHIARAVIAFEILSRQAVEDVEVPDDRMPVRALAESGGEHQLRAHAVRIVEAHGELAADHFLLLGELFRGKHGMHRGVG